ncbi:hypothetical protein [Nocardia sp. NPDC004415]
MSDDRSIENALSTPDTAITALAQQVATARGKIGLQHDTALYEALSDAEIRAERELAEWVRAQRRKQRRRAVADELATDRRDRRTGALIRRADEADARWHRKALAARRRVSSADARLAQLYRRSEWSSRALIGVVVLGMVWAGVNVQRNLVPSGDMSDPLYWLSYGIEAMISIPIIVIMITATTAARWGRELERGKVLLFELALLGTTVALNAGPHLAAGSFGRAAEYAIAPVMVGVVIWLHAWVSARYAMLIEAASVGLPGEVTMPGSVEFLRDDEPVRSFVTQPKPTAVTAGPLPGSSGADAADIPDPGTSDVPAPAAARTPAAAEVSTPAATSAPAATEVQTPAAAEVAAPAATPTRAADAAPAAAKALVPNVAAPAAPTQASVANAAPAEAAAATPAATAAAATEAPTEAPTWSAASTEAAAPIAAPDIVGDLVPPQHDSHETAMRDRGIEGAVTVDDTQPVIITTGAESTPAEQGATVSVERHDADADAGTSVAPNAGRAARTHGVRRVSGEKTTAPGTLELIHKAAAEHRRNGADHTVRIPAPTTRRIPVTAVAQTPAGDTTGTDPVPEATAHAGTVARDPNGDTSAPTDSTVVHNDPQPPADEPEQLTLTPEPASPPATPRLPHHLEPDPAVPQQLQDDEPAPTDDIAPTETPEFDDPDPTPDFDDDTEVRALARQIANRNPLRLTIDQIEEILELTDRSWSAPRIGAEVGLSGSTVTNIVEFARKIRHPYAFTG